MSRKAGLGKGLDALLPGNENVPAENGSASFVPITNIIPNPHQPRIAINESGLNELADSIREHGILQPLMVTVEPGGNRYILIAGERRLRAASMVGLTTVPVIIRQASDRELLELALIENIQRADLSPLETAEAYRQLQETFNLTHEEIAGRVGKSRVAVTNTLRLLKLPDAVRSALAGGKISEGHARALLMLQSSQAQLAALQSVLRNDLSVRQTEALIHRLGGEKDAPPAAKVVPPEIHAVEERLLNALGTRVTLRHGRKGGTITIHYYSDEELEGLIRRFTGE